MLKQFSRLEKTRSAFIIVFALLMIVSLIFFYAPTRDAGAGTAAASREVVARVRGDEVIVADFDDAERAIKQNYGPQVSMKMLGGARRVLDDLIGSRIVEQEANRLGLKPSDKEVGELIIKRFTDPATGRFVGSERYKQNVVAQYGDLHRFEAQVRRSLAEQKLQAFVTSGVTVSDEEVQTEFERTYTSFDLVYVNVTAAELAKGLKPSDEEVRKYFDEHGEEFRINEPQKKIRYIFVNQEKVGGTLQVSDEDLRKEYDVRKPQAGVRVQQIVLRVPDPKLDQQVLTKATELVSRLRPSADNLTATEEAFAELARGNSEDAATAKNGGWLPAPVKKSATPTGNILESTLDMQPGQVGDPLFSKGAYYIFRRGDSVPKTFEESRQELLVSLRNRRSHASAAGIARRAAERLRETKDFQQVAQELAADANMSPAEMIKETPFVKPQDDVPDIGSSAQFEEAIKPLENPQDVGEPVGIKNGFAVPVLVEKRDPRVPEFDEVREKVAERVRQEQAKGRVEQAAREIAAAAGNAGELKAAAERFGLKVEEVPGYRLSTPLGPAGRSPATDEAIFALKPGDVTKTPVKVGDSWIIAGATKRNDADPAEFGRQRDRLIQTALDERRRQVFDDYQSALRARLDGEGEIKIYEDVLKRVDADSPTITAPRPGAPPGLPLPPVE